jgi:hypothetical protein
MVAVCLQVNTSTNTDTSNMVHWCSNRTSWLPCYHAALLSKQHTTKTNGTCKQDAVSACKQYSTHRPCVCTGVS